jgi:hypothetical protein
VTPFWNSPVMALFICIFQNSTVPLQPFPANFLKTSRPCTLCNLAYTAQPPFSRKECTAATQSSSPRKPFCTSLCQLWKKTQRGASSWSKGWDRFPNGDGGDERMWGWSPVLAYITDCLVKQKGGRRKENSREERKERAETQKKGKVEKKNKDIKNGVEGDGEN